MWEVGQNKPFSQMSAILKFDFQKGKQLHFSEDNYFNYTKRHNFACDILIFPKTRGNKNKKWAHLGTLKSVNILRRCQPYGFCTNHTFPSGTIAQKLSIQQLTKSRNLKLVRIVPYWNVPTIYSKYGDRSSSLSFVLVDFDFAQPFRFIA